MKDKCEHLIGILYDWEETDVVTVEQLKDSVESECALYEKYQMGEKPYTFSDYCDRRKNTNLTNFNHCPLCGEKIDWKAIKKGDKNERQRDYQGFGVLPKHNK